MRTPLILLLGLAISGVATGQATAQDPASVRQLSRADSAAVLIQAARELTANDEPDAAQAVLRLILDRFGDTPSAARRQTERDGGRTTRKGIRTVATPPEPAAGEPPVQGILLMASSAAGDLPDVRQLLSGGVDPNWTDSGAWTPLHLAASYGHVHVLDALLSQGADPTAKNRAGDTPLDIALTMNQETSASVLLEWMDDSPR